MNATSHNQLDLSIEESGWEKLKSIHVDREGEHVHTLRPKVNSVYHRLLCEVKLVDNVKVVTFRSTFLVENRSLVNAEMVIVDGNGKKSSKVYTIRKFSFVVLSFHPDTENVVMTRSSGRGLCCPDFVGLQ